MEPTALARRGKQLPLENRRARFCSAQTAAIGPVSDPPPSPGQASCELPPPLSLAQHSPSCFEDEHVGIGAGCETVFAPQPRWTLVWGAGRPPSRLPVTR